MQLTCEPIQNPFIENSHGLTDEELALAAKSGDGILLETLLTRHFPWLFNLSLRMLHRRQDAEDATQEILFKDHQGST